MNETGKMKIDRCISRLVLSQPFYAALALRLKRVEDPSAKTAVWSDGVVLAYNPEKLEAMRDDVVVGTVCKLVEALAHQHHTRRESRNPKMWNKASASVCATIAEGAGFELSEEDKAFSSDQWKDKSAEGVYRILEALPPDPNGDGDKDGQGDGQGQGGGQGGAGSDDDGNGQGQGQGQGNGNGAGSGEIRDYPGDAAATQAAEQEWKNATFQAVRVAQAQGNCPDHAKRLIDELVTPKVDWREELRRFVSAVSHERYNWTSPNRRYVHQGLYLPSRRSREVGEIALVVDTSGSIDDEALKAIAGEMSGILEEYPSARLTVVYCDAAVHGHEVFTSQDCPITLHAIGGGGTDFRPAFRWIKENMEQPPKCLVFMTDLLGSFPEQEPDYPVLWGVVNREEGYSPAPFGDCVYVEVEREQEEEKE